VAGGGDGTINAVVDVLLDYPKIKLGVLPLGTFNNFARTLGIPLDIDEALKVLLAGYVTHVDVGQVNGHAFVNNSGIGAYPALVRHREWQQEQGKSKKLAFFFALMRTIFYCPFLRLDFIVAGEKLSRKTPVVFIGNNEYKLEGLEIGTRERLDKSALSLYITHASTHWQFFWLCLQVLLAGPKGASKLDLMTIDTFTIHARKKRLRVSVDGEVLVLSTPLTYRILPKALAVISI
jgi:diacylglycerol kinase family enzyme